MSWREILGVSTQEQKTYTHNPHNTQKSLQRGNCADIANYAFNASLENNSILMEQLYEACKGLEITAAQVKEALTPEDFNDWHQGNLSNETLAALAFSLQQRQTMNQGKRPENYTKHAFCQQCGPIWLWCSGEFLACPWCWNRVADKPIPSPN